MDLELLPIIISKFLQELGFSGKLLVQLQVLAMLLIIFLICVIINFLTKKILIRIIGAMIRFTNTRYDDILYEKKVFHSLSHIFPAIFIYNSIDLVFRNPKTIHIFQALCLIYLITAVWFGINSFLNAMKTIFQKQLFQYSHFPIHSFIQIVKVIFFIIGAVFMLSVIFDRSPATLLTGLGAFTAVLILVFKDTILGFVATIQLALNKMVKIGDHISIPHKNADGKVLDISITTVKIQNWDASTLYIPTYSLVSDTFRNWTIECETNKQKIRRAFGIDVSSVKFCSTELLRRLKENKFLANFLQENAEKRFSNLELYKKFLTNFLKENFAIYKNFTIKELQSSGKDILMEIFAIVNENQITEIQKINIELFENFFAAANEFELKII